MIFKYMIMFLALTGLSSVQCRTFATKMIKEVAINRRYYPEQYMYLSCSLKKFLNVKHSDLPKFLCAELLISRIFLILGPIYTVIAGLVEYCISVATGALVAIILVHFHGALILINTVILITVSILYKKDDIKRQNQEQICEKKTEIDFPKEKKSPKNKFGIKTWLKLFFLE